MSFDVCIGVSESELNNGASSVYQRLYPNVFTGETQIDKGPITFTAKFDVKSPPVFDLEPVAAQPDALLAAVRDRLGENRELTPEDEELVRYAAESTSNFTVRLAAVNLTLTAPDTPSTELNLDVTAHCSVVTAGGLVSFAVNSVTAADQPDPFDQLVVQKFVLPSLQSSLQQLFGGLTIPSFDVPGVPLGPPLAVLWQRRLFALATVAGHGDPSFDSGLPWPGAGFFALLSETALQAAASYAIASSGDLSSSGQSGSDAFEAYYHFDMKLVNPHVTIDGAGLNVAFSLTGSVGAGVHVLWIPISLSYAVQAAPNPAAVTQLVPEGSELVVIESRLSPFTVAVVPDGDIPSKVLSWMTEFIVQGVAGALTPLITGFLTGIRFASLKIPTYVESISGVTVTMTPVNLSVSNVAGNIALTGSLQFS